MAEETVLIIEDDPALLRGLQDNFAQREYTVLCVTDGERGLELALKSKPNLIILDIMLPKINGYEVCRSLRERKVDTPIIMLTAKTQEEDIVLGLNLGADDYVTKPFSIKELLARANALLRRHRSGEANIYHFGRCTLDLAARKLYREEQEITLTPKEFNLLALFCRRIGRALTRDEILAQVWGRGILVTHRSVDRCINTLRNKIEPDPHNPAHIQTVRDIGYRFEMLDNEEGLG